MSRINGFLAKIPRLGNDVAPYHITSKTRNDGAKPKIIIFAHCPTFGGLERR